MYVKVLGIIFLLIVSFYSEGTNASELKANTCSLGLPPFSGSTFDSKTQKYIISAFQDKGFFVTVMTNPNEVSEHEFYTDTSVECTKTYFGTHAQTTIRLIESASEKISAKFTTAITADIFQCKSEIFEAIKNLPNCKIK